MYLQIALNKVIFVYAYSEWFWIAVYIKIIVHVK